MELGLSEEERESERGRERGRERGGEREGESSLTENVVMSILI